MSRQSIISRLQFEKAQIAAAEKLLGLVERDLISFPEDHQPGMRVPAGGSSCAKCNWLADDGLSCTNDYFIKWNGGTGLLPYPANEYCSDWFEWDGQE